jgi:hypothetical protein
LNYESAAEEYTLTITTVDETAREIEIGSSLVERLRFRGEGKDARFEVRRGSAQQPERT